MFRRVLSLMLCVCMLVSTMPTWSVAALAEGEEAVVEVVEAPKEEKDPTPKPTKEPTPEPTKEPTPEPTKEPTPEPTKEPTPEPTKEPTPEPTKEPTPEPTKEPTPEPTEVPAAEPEVPAEEPTEAPTEEPTEAPAEEPAEAPAEEPAEAPAEEPTEAPTEEPTEAPVEEAPRFVNGYAFVKAGEKVYADEDLDEVLGTFPEKTVVYVSDREETQDEDQDILTLRFACEDKLVKGYIRAKRVQPLTDRESADYEEEAAADGVRYRDQIFVMSVAFDFADAKDEQPAAAETEQPAADETEQPAASETEQPAAVETEQPAAVETEQPAASETEQPAAGETEEPAADETEEPAAGETEEPAAENPAIEEGQSNPPQMQAPAFEGGLAEGDETPTITLGTTELDVTVGTSCWISVSGSYDKDSNMLIWTSSDSKVIRSTYQNGDFLATGVGEAVLTCKVKGTDVSATCKVKVRPALTLAAETFELKVGSSVALNPQTNPAEGVEITWAMNQEGTVSIDGDTMMLTALAEGSLPITFTATHTKTKLATTMPISVYVEAGSTSCAHEATETQVSYDLDDCRPDYGTDTHNGYGSKKTTVVCTACGATLSTQTITGRFEGLPHTFVDEICTKCGVKYCDHDFGNNTGWEYRLVGDVVANEDGITHTGLFDIIQDHRCEKCGEWFILSVEKNVEATRNHIFANNGICEVCGAENTCKHENTYSREYYEKINDDTPLKADVTGHWGRMRHVWEKTCADCGMELEDINEEVIIEQQDAKKHEWENGICQICGYENPCKHENVREAGPFYQFFNGGVDNGDGTHTGERTRYYARYCADCEADLENRIINQETVTAKHEWFEGTCDVCGAENLCEHSWTTIESNVPSYFRETAHDNGDGTHTVDIEILDHIKCTICDEERWVILTPEKTITDDKHVFYGDDCWVCGAKNPCKHPKASRTTETLHYIDEVLEVTEYYHVVTYNVFKQDYCLKCDNFIGDRTDAGQATLTEAHYFGNGGECDCGKIGKTNSACVEDWETHFNAKADGTRLENERFEPIEGTVGQTRHRIVATQVKAKQCSVCGDLVGTVTLEEITKTAVHKLLETEDGKYQCTDCGVVFDEMPTAIDWDIVPDVNASQTGDKTVKLEWDANADSAVQYRVVEWVNGVRKTIDTTAATSYTITNAALGTHEYGVYPYNTELKEEGENGARITFVVQSGAWKVAPVISAAAQVPDAEGLVKLTWTHKSRAESYEVYDSFNGKVDKIAATTELSIVLEGQAPGKHSYTVKPVQKDSWGNPQEGTSSKAKLVTVAELWNKKPTLSVAVQKTSDQFGDPVEGLVSLSWKRAKGALTQAYAIQEYDAAKKTWSSVLPDGELVFSDEDVVTYSLQDVEAGKHTYRVVPASEDGKELGTANASASKAVTVIALWNKKGTITKAVQIKNVENLVELTWKSGSTATQAWQICERKKNGKSYDYEPVKVGGQICMITDSVVISAEIEAEPGTHDYVVRPVKIDDEGNAVDTGTVSSVKSVKVAELWKAAPKITSLKQVTNTDEDAAAAVELSWTPGSETTAAYAVYEKIGKNYELVEDVYSYFTDGVYDGVIWDSGEGLNSVTIPVTKAGAHTYIVRPVKVNEDYDVELNGNELIPGTASAAKSVTVKLATWADAPTLTAVQKKDEAEGEVLLQWSQYVQAEAFKIYEYKNKKDVPVQVDDEGEVVQEGGHDLIVKFGMTETVLKGVTDGTHTYSVRPLRYNETTGDYEEGKLSARKAVTVTTQWSLAPTITEAMQLTDSEESVYLKWKAGSPMTRAWYIKDGNNVVMNGNEPLLVYDTQVVLTGVDAGSHKYTVIPALLDDGKLLDSGKPSAAKSVKVYALWNKKPVIKSAVQLTADERKIEVKWTSPALLSEAFIVNVKYAGKMETVLFADEFDVGPGGNVTLKDGVYTAVIEAEGAGSNVISVAPAHWDDDAKKWVPGQASATKTVSVKDLWKLAPTKVTAQQIKTNAELQEIDEYADLGEGMVLLTWVSGSYPNLADEFRIYDNGKEIDLIENTSFIPVHVCGFQCDANNKKKHACQVILLGQSAGAHKYTVKPAVEREVNPGTTSVARALTVAELWKAKPTITNALQSSGDAITLIWKAGSEVRRDFIVTDKLGKTTKTYGSESGYSFDVDEDTYTLTISGLDYGTHELCVKPYDGVTTGTPSAVVKVTVANTQWDAAPVMLSVEQGRVGQATLTWNHPAPGKGFIVYEMVGTRFVEITDPIEMTEFSCTVKVESTGMHTYAVRSYTFDEAGNTLVGTMSRAMSAELYASSDAAPQNVRVTRDRNTARVTWNEVPFADGYTIRMVKLSDQSVTTSDVGRQTSTTFTNITPDESYRFDVVAVFDGEESSAASSGAVFFGRPVEAEAETYNPNDGGVVLTWSEPSAGAQGIKIYRMDGVQETLDEDEARIFSSNKWIANPRFVDDLAQPNKTYTYWVASYRSSGEDELSAPVVVSTEVKLDPVGQVSTYFYNEFVSLGWEPVSNATEYAVYRAEGANPAEKDYVWIGDVYAYDGFIDYIDEVEDANRTYTYRIVSRWEAGNNWIEGAPSTVTIKPLAKPMITSAAFDAATGAVKLTWNKVEGADRYDVYRVDSQKNEEQLTDTQETSFDDTTVELNNAYTYYVVAVKEDGECCAERTSNVKTVQLSRLGKVTGLTQWHVNKTVTLTWDAVPNAQYYVVERSSDGGESFVTRAENETKTSFEDAQVSDGETYLYRVSAAIKIGENVNLGAASTVTADISSIMEGVSARFSLKEGGAVITWPKSDKADATGYKIFRTEQGSTADPEVIEIEGVDTTTWTDTAVVDEVGKTFLYSVRVVRTSGEDGQSGDLEVKPVGLGTVQSIRFRYEENETILTWDEVEQAEYYEVTRTCNGKETTFESEKKATTVIDTLGKDDDLNATYVYTLRAVVKPEKGEPIYGKPSIQITVTRKPNVTNVELNPIEEGVEIKWDKMGTTDMFRFVISRKELDQNSTLVTKYEQINPDDPSAMLKLAENGTYIDTTAEAGKKYSYSFDVLYTSDIENQPNVRLYETGPVSMPNTLFTYEPNDDGKTATITGYSGKSAERMTKIPETVDGLTVTHIGDGTNPFDLPDGVTMTGTLTLPSTIKVIGANVFKGFSGLTGTLTLPDGLVSIANEAFYGTGITGVVIPAGMTYLGTSAFDSCASLESVVFNGAVQTMKDGVFASCTALESITLPEDMTKIPNDFVSGDAKLTGELIIPDSVTTIGENAFAGTGYTSLRSYAAVPYDELKKMGLRDTLEKLESDYDTDEEMSFEAFGLELQEERKALGKTFELILRGLASDGTLYDKAEDGSAIIIGHTNASGALVLPATVDGFNVTKIGENAFKDNTAITSVIINGNVKEIGDGAFDGCTSLTTAVLPNSVEIIGERGFANCASLTTMTAQ
ncbi:MAG: leucine-rich repeat protein [Candidatus Ventricola sp.]